MIKRTLVALVVLAIASNTFAESRQRYTIATNGALRGAALRIATQSEDAKARHVRRFSKIDGFAADLTAEEAEELRNSAGVIAVQPVVERRISDMGGVQSNLESYTHQVTPWGLPYIHAEDVWPVTRGEGINVVVLDTGIDLNHPDLKDAIVGGYNVLQPSQPPMDDNFHGTHVAGIIAAQDNGFGVIGIAPKVKLWAVKALDQEGKGFDETVAAGIDWVVNKQSELGGRWVINMSIGAASKGGTLEEKAIDRAFAAGIIMIAAAGNRGTAFLDYPAAYRGVIPVGAIGEDGRKADFSSYGFGMPIVAPGVEVPSTLIAGVAEAADVIIQDDEYLGRGVIGSPFGSANGRIVDAKLGRPDELTGSVSGNIALIKRGDLEFREKVRNAKNAGAKAVVIWNNEDGDEPPLFTLLPRPCNDPASNQCPEEWRNYPFLLTIAVTRADGLKLQELADHDGVVSFFNQIYGRKTGTSMATPHVAATAALVLSLKPEMTPVNMEWLLRNSAHDTGDPGWDYFTGYGCVDALAAAQLAAPERFGVQPGQPKNKRRTTRP